MGYQSPYMRFGHTRYEKDIAKLRRYDLRYREETYKHAVEILKEALSMPDASPHYIGNVSQYATDCMDEFERGLTSDSDDAMLVSQFGVEALGQDEYDWMKDELAKKGEKVDDPWTSMTPRITQLHAQRHRIAT